MKAARPGPAFSQLPRISPTALRFFTAYSARLVRRHFHAMRILRSSVPPADCTQPLVFYANHPSWWDPLVFLLLAREHFRSRDAYGPIDAAMLERYGLFRRLGFFGIEQGTAVGARTFLRTAKAVLASSRNALWVTPQGRFADVRERPARLMDGLGALALRAPEAAFIPVAIEYSFWTEPRPEILIAFGKPLVPREAAAQNSYGWTQTFSEKLEATQTLLAVHSQQRDAQQWLTTSRGRSGVTFFYDAWRRLRARLHGGRFEADHEPEPLR